VCPHGFDSALDDLRVDDASVDLTVLGDDYFDIPMVVFNDDSAFDDRPALDPDRDGMTAVSENSEKPGPTPSSDHDIALDAALVKDINAAVDGREAASDLRPRKLNRTVRRPELSHDFAAHIADEGAIDGFDKTVNYHTSADADAAVDRPQVIDAAAVADFDPAVHGVAFAAHGATVPDMDGTVDRAQAAANRLVIGDVDAFVNRGQAKTRPGEKQNCKNQGRFGFHVIPLLNIFTSISYIRNLSQKSSPPKKRFGVKATF
jgi:hypothetical protein